MHSWWRGRCQSCNPVPATSVATRVAGTGLTSAASPRVHISSTCKVGQKLGEILYLSICSFLPCLSWLLRSRVRKSRRDLWITLYIYKCKLLHNFTRLILLFQGSYCATVPESIWTGPCWQLWVRAFLYHSSSAWFLYRRHQDGTSLKVGIKPVSTEGYGALESWNLSKHWLRTELPPHRTNAVRPTN